MSGSAPESHHPAWRTDADRLAAVVEAQTAIALAGNGLDACLREVSRQAQLLGGGDGATVELPEGEMLVYYGSTGTLAASAGLPIARASSLTGMAFDAQEVLYSVDTSADARVDPLACARSGIASMIVVPLIDDGRSIGVLKVSSGRPAAFDEVAVTTVKLMAGLAATTLSRLLTLRALEASEARGAALLEHASDIITINDAEFNLLYASPALGRVLGYCSDERVGGNMLDLVHPDDRPALLAATPRFLAEPGAVVTLECRLRHRDGSWRHMEITRVNRLHDAAVNGIVTTNRDVTERSQLAAQLAHDASHDSLTGLPNRALCLDRLNQALARAGRRQRPCGVFFVDLDNFKAVNDTLGHAAGDELLRIVAQRLQGAVRPADTVARLGGDEFVVLAEELDGCQGAAGIAERIALGLGQPALLGEAWVTPGCSIGVALGVADTPEALLQRADVALYRAKQGGRGRFEIEGQDLADRGLSGSKDEICAQGHQFVEQASMVVPAERLSSGSAAAAPAGN